MKPLKIIELDFGMGNIRSLQKAFEYLNQPVEVVNKYENHLKDADILLLPGDGAFPKAMEEIKQRGFYDLVQEFHRKQKPIFGVCIGFQILFELSEEFGISSGFSFLKGKFIKFNHSKLPTPHMGWTLTHWKDHSVLGKNIKNNFFYYVHSYYVSTNFSQSFYTSHCNYGTDFIASIEKDNIFAVQFHPEKSSKDGLKVIENFLNFI